VGREEIFDIIPIYRSPPVVAELGAERDGPAEIAEGRRYPEAPFEAINQASGHGNPLLSLLALAALRKAAVTNMCSASVPYILRWSKMVS
jgi:hypothetical protein